LITAVTEKGCEPTSPRGRQAHDLAGGDLQAAGAAQVGDPCGDLRRQPVAMDVPERSGMAQEGLLVRHAPAAPQVLGGRPQGVDGGSPSVGGGRTPQPGQGGQGRNVRGGRRGRPDRRFALVLTGRQASPRQGDDRAAGQGVLQAQRHVDHGQSRAEQQHRSLRQAGRGPTPRIGDIGPRGGQGLIHARRAARRGIAERQHDGVDQDRTAHGRGQPPAVAAWLQSHNGVRRDHQPARALRSLDDRCEQALQIAAVVAARGEVPGADVEAQAPHP
jgi:hypothetical protein